MLSSIPPLQDDEETIDYIIKEIYDHKKLEPICSKLIFRRLLMKLATECTFTINGKFCKQVDGCTMGGSLSVTFCDIYMTKMENEVVLPIKPIFYKRYVDDIYSRRKKGDNYLFNRMNSYHPNIKLTIELNPSKFLDTKLKCINVTYKFNVHRKETKLPIPWTSKVPKRYKRNTIDGDLHRSQRISSNFDEEIPLIKEQFLKADYPLRFVNSVINEFHKSKEILEENFIIPPNIFEEEKPFILIEIPYCELNEAKSKHFLKKFHTFTNGSFRLAITWKTRKIRTLFPLKDKSDYQSCVIYKGICSCGSSYVGETKRNALTRWGEHNNPTKKSEPSKHLRQHIEHVFTWTILCRAPKNTRTRKNLEASFIALLKPDLNEQSDFDILVLFRNGVT